MTEHIEREALLERIDDIGDCNDMVFRPNDHCCNVPEDCKGCKWVETRDAIRRIVENAPAADVRPAVKATWIVKEMQALFPGMDEHPVFVCSECGYQIYDLLDNVKERHHFCPNCGARMEES